MADEDAVQDDRRSGETDANALQTDDSQVGLHILVLYCGSCNGNTFCAI